MPYLSKLDLTRRIAFVEFSGEVTYLEIEEYIRQLSPTSGFESTFTQLIDAELATGTDLHQTEMEMETLCSHDPFSPEVVRVIVAPTDYLYGLARMYQLMLDRSTLSVVRTRSQALQLLGITCVEQ